MDVLKNIEPTFTVIGAILALIVIYYVKGVMHNIEDIKNVPRLIQKVDELLNKIENLMIKYAAMEQRLHDLERRIERLESIE